MATPPNAGEDVEKLEHSVIAGKNVKRGSSSGKRFGSFLETCKRNYHPTQELRLWAFIPEKRRLKFTKKNQDMDVYSTLICNSQKAGNSPDVPQQING